MRTPTAHTRRAMPTIAEQIRAYRAAPEQFHAEAQHAQRDARIARPLRQAPAPPPMPQTRGEELLRALPNSNREIALALGVTAPAVNQWRRGQSRPDDANARALEQHFGIPRAAWQRRSHALEQALASVSQRTR
jgi:transcriptional regulator with XRE-family HTH domain